jgi:hypothetical protein
MRVYRTSSGGSLILERADAGQEPFKTTADRPPALPRWREPLRACAPSVATAEDQSKLPAWQRDLAAHKETTGAFSVLKYCGAAGPPPSGEDPR